MNPALKSAPDAETIRRQLHRILVSRVFLSAQRSQAFLRYVVERSLVGSVPKEYEIAVDVFERRPNYDPAVDATVRVEAGRLRNRLREYYQEEGEADPIVVDIPKGGYAAVFSLREAQKVSEAAPFQRARSEQNAAAAVGANSQPSAAAAQKPGNASRLKRWVAIVGGVAAIAALALWFGSQRPHAAGPIRSLAVLPLQNLSGDPNQAYFADGISDELTTDLARSPDLRVVSSTSVMQDNKEGAKPLHQIAADLNVDAIVEGSVVRVGDRVRVTARLFDARVDRQLWAQTFEEQMSDVLTLQDEVAGEIAAQTQVALLPARAVGALRVNPSAYDAYLRGLYFLNRREAHKSAGYFQQALSYDPSSAMAYAGLAEALASERVLGEPTEPDTESRALAAATQAIELNPNNGQAYAAQGLIEMNYEKDWAAAGRNLEKAIALAPSYSFAEMQYSLYLDAMGRADDAVTHMRLALRLDPLSFYMNRHLGSVLYLDRHYDEALFYLRRAEEMEPDRFRVVENWAALSYEETGKFNDAVNSDLRELGARFSDAQLAPVRRAYRRHGWRAYQSARAALLSQYAQNADDAFDAGESFIRLGDRARAFAFIHRAADEHCPFVDLIQVDPVFDSLRSDPRYPALLRSVHLSPDE
jgi:TolB-like protein